MKNNKLCYFACLLTVCSLTAISSYSVTRAFYQKGVSSLNYHIWGQTFTVNYYVPNAEGNAFVLNSSEVVPEGHVIQETPNDLSISNFSFEKWSTNSSLSDSFNTSTPINQDYNLYAGYCGYYVKGISDGGYTLLNSESGNANKYRFDNDNNTPYSFSYSYSLTGTVVGTQGLKIASSRLQGSTIKAYKRYYGTASYSEIATGTSLTSDGLYKVYLNPSANNESDRLYFTRSFIIELQDWEANVNIHLWKSSQSSITTKWPGISANYLCRTTEDNKTKKYWTLDVDIARVDRIIVNDSVNSKQTSDIYFENNTKDTYWSYQFGSGGWFNFDDTKNWE